MAGMKHCNSSTAFRKHATQRGSCPFMRQCASRTLLARASLSEAKGVLSCATACYFRLTKPLPFSTMPDERHVGA